jgi:excisionase family DNA binding protein
MVIGLPGEGRGVDCFDQTLGSARPLWRRAMSAQRNFVSPPLLTISEAAKYLGVGRKIVYELIERGEITAVKSGASTLIEKASLDTFKSEKRLT